MCPLPTPLGVQRRPLTTPNLARSYPGISRARDRHLMPGRVTSDAVWGWITAHQETRRGEQAAVSHPQKLPNPKRGSAVTSRIPA